MKDQSMDLRVTIVRPSANETPKKIHVGLSRLARVIAGKLKGQERQEEEVSVNSILGLSGDPDEI